MALVPRVKIPRTWRITWTVLLTVLAGLVALQQTLDRKLQPSTMTWIHSDGLAVGLVGLLCAATIVDAVFRAYKKVTAPAVQRRRILIRNQLGQIVVAVATVADRPIPDIGCGLFLRQARWIKRPERLFRTERMRLVDVVHESKVEYVKGKGTVGECWANLRPAHMNWVRINRKYGAADISDATWGNIPADVTRGFTKTEFTSLVGKYREVLAVPIALESGEFVGCLSLDLTWKQDDDLRPLLTEENVKTLLSAAARTIVPVLKP